MESALHCFMAIYPSWGVHFYSGWPVNIRGCAFYSGVRRYSGLRLLFRGWGLYRALGALYLGGGCTLTQVGFKIGLTPPGQRGRCKRGGGV